MPIIEIKGVSKHFPPSTSSLQQHQVLSDISFAIEPGEIHGITGKSGAGKSTLMRCLVGLEKPSQGNIIFEGEDIVPFSKEQIISYRKNIGMVFQHYNLFPSRTVGQNIAYPMEIHGVNYKIQQQRIEELLCLVHLENKYDVYPSCLSGGEKQRVAIARALANNPKILFCDEATSALDHETMKSLLSLFKELNRKLGLTIIAITHQMDFVKKICSNVTTLSHGKLVINSEDIGLIHESKGA
ncbi:MAG: ATP-binding cassette domain-containing protein [Parachlamydiaceae bacterium]|nr:ATP-binding cassette domain-containing protein [Parachlamydiaceae bacterium]